MMSVSNVVEPTESEEEADERISFATSARSSTAAESRRRDSDRLVRETFVTEVERQLLVQSTEGNDNSGTKINSTAEQQE